MDATFFRNADHAEAFTRENGGGTFKAGTLRLAGLTRGYAVGIAVGVGYSDRSERLHSGYGAKCNPSYPGSIAAAIREVTIYNSGAPYIGTWTQTHPNGMQTVHVDPVVVLPDLASALIVARAFHQQAIYDFATATVIEVK